MLSLLRKNRRKELYEGGMARYLFYAIGEIVLVVIGILIALQIDNWNRQYEQSKQEERILRNLTLDLEKDIKQLTNLRDISKARQANIDTLYDVMLEPEEHTPDRFLNLVFPLFYEGHFEVNSGTFDESLGSGTIRFIRNDTLRQQVFEYYRQAKLSYADKGAVKMTYEFIMPQLAETVVPTEEFMNFFTRKRSNLPPIDLVELSRNKKFMALLITKYGNEADQVNNWSRYMKDGKALLKGIKQELE